MNKEKSVIHPIVMIPSNRGRLKETGVMYIDSEGKLIQNLNNSNQIFKDCIYQHLYVLSEKEIEDYNSLVLINDKIIHKLKGIDDFHGYNVGLDGENYTLKKIIATTNKFLIEPTVHLIHEDFIEVFVNSYNEKKPIKFVDVEYEIKGATRPNSESSLIPHFGLKVQQDNTIVINQIRNYSTKEVKSLFEKMKQELCHSNPKYIETIGPEEITDWVNKNL